MSPTAYVFIAYPISRAYSENVNRVTGPNPEYILIAELRNMGIRKMFYRLLTIERGSTIFIPLEDAYSAALLPVLLSVASLSAASRLIVIDPDCNTRAIRRIDALGAVFTVLLTSGIGLLALVRCWLLVRRLESEARLKFDSAISTPDILYLNANLWFGVRAGGSVGHIAGVVNGLSTLGHSVNLVSANHQVMLRDGIQQTLLEPPKAFGFPYELNYLKYNFAIIRPLKQILRKRSYSFIYQRMSIMNCVGVMLSNAFRIPLVLEYNGSEVWVAKNWGRPLHFCRLALRIENICLKHAFRIVVVSTALAEELVARGIERHRIVTYPNCVDLEHYSPDTVKPGASAALRARHGLSPGAIVVGFVGTFGRWHGATILAAAIKKMVDHDRDWLERENVRFLLVGDGLLMNEVRELIGSDKFASWVTFTGLIPQAETVEYLAAADIVVSPHVPNADGSKFFGSPTKLFEYMAMAKGIIASDLDQIGEVLSTGIRIWETPIAVRKENATAILVRPGNIDDLIESVKLLVLNPELRNRLGANAHREVIAKYTWLHHVSAILNSIEGIPAGIPESKAAASLK
jgi:glycosyltransferase involved in cell wall biosynthesis